MKFAATAAAATVLATGVSAQQLSSPLELLQYASRLLTTECRTAVTELVTTSELASCLQVTNLLPILNNANTSVIPDINDYLVDLCAAEACDPSVIQNATETVTSACATDLSKFGITKDTVEFVMNAYPTAREVACLSSNDTELVNVNSTTNASSPVNATVLMNTSPSSNTSASSNNSASSNTSVLCPTALLYRAEKYLGVNFTNTYIDSLLLGANATAYRQILEVPRNGSVISGLACNDCVTGGLQVVLRDYPQLENLTFTLALSNVEEYTNYTLPGVNATERAENTSTWTVSSLYEGFCDVELPANSSLPASINSTAYNTTESSNTTSTPISSSTLSKISSTATAAGGIVSSALASATSLSATGGIVSSVLASATSLPVPVQSIGSSAVAAATSAVAPTKRFVKWD